MEAPITTEVEAILQMEYEPEITWIEEPLPPAPDVVAEEKELTFQCGRRCLDVLYDVDREFIQINLGLID